MNSYERFKSDILNGIIKAIELVDINSCSEKTWANYLNTIDKREFDRPIENSVIKNNVHALIYNCPISVVGFNNEVYRLKIYSKDLNGFFINDTPYPDESYYKMNDYSFKYDGNYIEYNTLQGYKKYKVHKNKTFFLIGGIDIVQQ